MIDLQNFLKSLRTEPSVLPSIRSLNSDTHLIHVSLPLPIVKIMPFPTTSPVDGVIVTKAAE